MKTNKILLLCLLFISLSYSERIFGQEQFTALSFGRSYNGTGDLYGFQYGATYSKYFKEKRIYWGIGFEGTLHDDEIIDYTFTDEQGKTIEGKSRFVTSGLQIVGNLGYDFLKSNNNRLGLSIGPLVRYQSSSIPDVVNTIYPALTELPVPVQIIEYREPFRTVALGAVLKINYRYIFKNDFLIGFTGGLQFDTNGDTISYVSLTFGKRFL